MRRLAACLIFVLASKWVEYRFGRDYGENFFDYSMNGRYGVNGNSNALSKVMSTDRGIYMKYSTSYISTTASGSFPLTFTATVWILAEDLVGGIVHFTDSLNNFSIGRGMAYNTIRFFISKTNFFLGNTNCFPESNYYSDRWILVTFAYANNILKGYADKSECYSRTFVFQPQTLYNIGLGYHQFSDSLKSFLWNFLLFDETIDLNSLIEIGSSISCIYGPGTCMACSIQYKDPDLGSGCLSTNLNPSQDSSGAFCSVPEGCLKSIKLKCPYPNSFCTFDYLSKSCYKKELPTPSSEPLEIQVNCECVDGLAARDFKCCPPISKTCNWDGLWTTCFASNADYNEGACVCKQGYYSAGDFEKSDNCHPCGIGCSKCSSADYCDQCKDLNALQDQGNCFCKKGFFENPSSDNCTKCDDQCASCTRGVCDECIDQNSYIFENKCRCFQGFFFDFEENVCEKCSLGCLSCSDSECFECVGENSRVKGRNCICKNGFWRNGSIDSNNSCLSCHSECLSCEEDSKCISCKSLNAEIGAFVGCRCKKGFWNQTALTLKNSCKPCNEDCEICSSFDTCLKCKAGRGELNSSKSCVKLCWKSSISEQANCKNCPVLCVKCNEDFQCFLCANDSHVDQGNCICDKGFTLNNNLCEQMFFFGELKISENNLILLRFTEALLTKLDSEIIELSLDGKVIDFSFFEKNSTTIFIKPKIKRISSNRNGLVLNIKLGVVRSVSYSILANMSYSGTLNSIKREDSSLESISKNFIKVSVFVALGTSLVSNPSIFWSLLNTIQLLIYMPLNSVTYPEKLKTISSSFLDYFVFPNFLEYFISSTCTSIPYKNAYEFGIESSVVLLNIGSHLNLLLPLMIYIFILVTTKKCYQMYQKLVLLREKHKYNLFITFWIQSYLDIGIYSLIQLKSVCFT